MSKDCINCGAKIQDDCAYCTSCGAKQPVVKRCAYCGNYVDEKEYFCTVCGKNIYEDNEQHEKRQNFKSTSMVDMPALTLGQAVSSCFLQFATFKGRASRSEFWWWSFFTTLVYLCAFIMDSLVLQELLRVPISIPIFGWITSLILFLPQLAVAVRRMHDTNHSGWFLLIPVYRFILSLFPTDEYENNYGSLPSITEARFSTKIILSPIIIVFMFAAGAVLWLNEFFGVFSKSSETVNTSDTIIIGDYDTSVDEEKEDVALSFSEAKMFMEMDFEDKERALEYFRDQKGLDFLYEYEESNEDYDVIGLNYHVLYFGNNATVTSYNEETGATFKATGKHAYIIPVKISGDARIPEMFIHEENDMENMKKDAINMGYYVSSYSDDVGYIFTHDSESNWFRIYQQY